jgi:hypothetical protein
MDLVRSSLQQVRQREQTSRVKDSIPSRYSRNSVSATANHEKPQSKHTITFGNTKTFRSALHASYVVFDCPD